VTGHDEDRMLRRRNIRLALVLGALSLGVYVVFFVIKGLGL
jgi:hypothetical protein